MILNYFNIRKKKNNKVQNSTLTKFPPLFLLPAPLSILESISTFDTFAVLLLTSKHNISPIRRKIMFVQLVCNLLQREISSARRWRGAWWGKERRGGTETERERKREISMAGWLAQEARISRRIVDINLLGALLVF